MTQPKASRKKVSKKGKYGNVPEMVRDLSEDKEFAASVTKEIARRNIINLRMAMRASQGLSQKDIAAKMGCTQSRISKLESSKDDDLRIGDFHAYAEAIGLQLAIFMMKKGRPPIAERIKYHTSALRQLFAELCDLVGDDDAIRKGAFKVASEAACTAATGLAKLVQDIVRKLPPPADKPTPIQVEMQGDESEGSSNTACEEGRCSTPSPC